MSKRKPNTRSINTDEKRHRGNLYGIDRKGLDTEIIDHITSFAAPDPCSKNPKTGLCKNRWNPFGYTHPEDNNKCLDFDPNSKTTFALRNTRTQLCYNGKYPKMRSFKTYGIESGRDFKRAFHKYHKYLITGGHHYELTPDAFNAKYNLTYLYDKMPVRERDEYLPSGRAIIFIEKSAKHPMILENPNPRANPNPNNDIFTQKKYYELYEDVKGRIDRFPNPYEVYEILDKNAMRNSRISNIMLKHLDFKKYDDDKIVRSFFK